MRLVSISDPEDSRLADYRIVSDGELIKRRGLLWLKAGWSFSA